MAADAWLSVSAPHNSMFSAVNACLVAATCIRAPCSDSIFIELLICEP
jgi:hypothetical protein